jgi:hypothetical protein
LFQKTLLFCKPKIVTIPQSISIDMFAICNNHKDQKKRLLFRRKVLFSPTALSGTLFSDRRCKSVNPSSTSAELLDGCPCEASCTRDGVDSEDELKRLMKKSCPKMNQWFLLACFVDLPASQIALLVPVAVLAVEF